VAQLITVKSNLRTASWVHTLLSVIWEDYYDDNNYFMPI